MRRIIVVLTVAVLMLAMSALPALAKNTGTEGGGPPVVSGNTEDPEGRRVVHCQAFPDEKSVAVVNHKEPGKQTGNCRPA